MAVLTQRQVEDAFWRATVLALELDPDAIDNQSRVRVSWPSAETGNSHWERDENTVFLHLTPAYDDYTVLKDITHVYDAAQDELKEHVEYHRCFQMQWICYGPDAAEDADAIRIGILRGAAKAHLKSLGIALLPNIREPVRAPEMDDAGVWWDRHDVTAQCYALVSREYAEGIIEHIPPVFTAFGADGNRQNQITSCRLDYGRLGSLEFNRDEGDGIIIYAE